MTNKDESAYNMSQDAKDQGDSFQFEEAHGPDGLWDELNKLLEHAKLDPSFLAKDHYIMYVLGDQRSLIKIDMTKKPFEFWYCDKLGRPPTKAVKEMIAKFMWEKAGEKERLGDQVI